jgi:hypothetical protein
MVLDRLFSSKVGQKAVVERQLEEREAAAALTRHPLRNNLTVVFSHRNAKKKKHWQWPIPTHFIHFNLLLCPFQPLPSTLKQQRRQLRKLFLVMLLVATQLLLILAAVSLVPQ